MAGPVIHSQALCEATAVGDDSYIGAFAHVYAKAVIGRGTTIGDHAVVADATLVGNRVVVGAGVQIAGNVVLQDDVVLGSNVLFSSNHHLVDSEPGVDSRPTVVEQGAVVGGGSVITQDVRIGRNARVSDGAVVTRDVPAFAIVAGNPAAITGYSDGTGQRMLSSQVHDVPQATLTRPVKLGSSIVHLRKATDLRGSLVVAELASDLPFVPRRFFIVYDVPSLDVRGEHAHLACEQFLVCVKGSVRAIVDDGSNRGEFLLNSADVGLYMPAMTWGTQYAYSSDAVLAVFASHPYDSEDYIRTYEEFQQKVKERADTSSFSAI